jgi:glutamate formiminotransferase/formiminotetrahydrofolate cyclodeaminase
MGVELKARNLAQVSMNLTDFETTPIGVAFDAVAREAAAHGAGIIGSEIVGLVPRRALDDAAVHYLKIENFHPELIVENRLARVLAEQAAAAAQSGHLRQLAEGFVAAVAAPTPTPGGGSVSALAGALAAALGEMVCGLTLQRKSFAAHHASLEESHRRLAQLRDRLLANIDRDAQSYDAVVVALKLPKSTESEQAVRARAMEEASKAATMVPLETAELVVETAQVVETLRPITLAQAASDLAVALHLAEAARRGALENVRANLPSIQDRDWIAQIEARAQRLANCPAATTGAAS